MDTQVLLVIRIRGVVSTRCRVQWLGKAAIPGMLLRLYSLACRWGLGLQDIRRHTCVPRGPHMGSPPGNLGVDTGYVNLWGLVEKDLRSPC